MTDTGHSTPAPRQPAPDSRDHDDQKLVAELLASLPAPEVSADFLARINARIDAEARGGWLVLADFRAWTLGLAPAAAALALVAVLWPASASRTATSSTASATPTSRQTSFAPSSQSDWQRDVTGDALLDAALRSAKTNGHAR